MTSRSLKKISPSNSVKIKDFKYNIKLEMVLKKLLKN